MPINFWSGKHPFAKTTEPFGDLPVVEDTWVICFHDSFDNLPQKPDPKRDEIGQLLEAIRTCGELIASFDFLPIAIAKVAKTKLEELRKNPIFKFAVEQKGDPTPYLTILKALDALRNQSLYQFIMWREHVQNGNELPSEDFEGGLWPEKPYPAFRGESKSRLLCAPAIMPVINLSIGPVPNIAYIANPVTVALEFISNTHLITVAAGNSGMMPVNEFAAMSSVCVGASEDRSGRLLASYSSFGGANTGIQNRGNDLIAFGGPPEESGTSYAAPRVAVLGCFCQAVLLQVTRLFRWIYHSQIAGVPLVGVGTLDVLNGSNALQGRIAEHATPIVTFAAELENAIRMLHRSEVQWDARIVGAQLKSMLCSMAELRSEGERDKWGFGFIDEEIVLKAFAAKTIREILAFYVQEQDLAVLDPRLLNAKFISMGELEQLWVFVARAAPIWVYDVETMSFQVNRTDGARPLVDLLPAHGHNVINAFQQVRIEEYLRLRDEWKTWPM